ncbi:DNRLRE domain-containing protein [Fredinandcohnia quinoae]|uniref:DNRLRE domain-containing protein n=1 Tax=Fredinandcohnia quinoae TaxID=2918902 RepID=A0AAW5E8J4_9BACI|nr:DNRLRE domain-containing protein [Fredinandcohnia sp. SECRCQ15]MCH1625960.1 DNRLRE domain-containing protein [Fredinandcohnia sp. SECRCQ15]
MKKKRTTLLLFILSIFTFTSLVFHDNKPKYAAELKNNEKNYKQHVEITPQEIKNLRTETSKTFKNNDGTLTTKIAQGPIHFKTDDEKWQPIENELIKNSKEGVYQNKANTFKVKFNEVQDPNEPIVQVGDNQHNAHFQLEPLKDEEPMEVKGIIEGESITYPEVYPNIDLKYTVGSDRIKEDIIYNDKPNQGFPDDFTYKMNLDGLIVKNEAGILYLIDNKTNEPIYYFETPFMYDAYKPEGFKTVVKSIPEEAISYDIKLSYEISDNNLYLHLTPNKKWLEDSSRVYPITIDPTIVKIQSSEYVEDTNLRSGFPTQTGGNDLEIGGGTSNGNTIRSLLKFDLSSIPQGSTIQSSSLNLWFSSTNGSTPIDISLFKVSKEWYENEASWNYAKISPSTAWINKGGDYVVSNNLAKVSSITIPTTLESSKKTWNVPVHIIQNWRKDITTNYGFIIKSDTEGINSYKKFISSEYVIEDKFKPLLEVTYTLPLIQQTEGPSGNTNVYDDIKGSVDLSWDSVPGAKGYKVWIFNGMEYEPFDVGNITTWSTAEKGIWPTDNEISSGIYKLHHDGLGVELDTDPSKVYKNAGLTYATRTNYFFRLTAYNDNEETILSPAFTPTLFPIIEKEVPIPMDIITEDGMVYDKEEIDVETDGEKVLYDLNDDINNIKESIEDLGSIPSTSNIYQELKNINFEEMAEEELNEINNQIEFESETNIDQVVETSSLTSEETQDIEVPEQEWDYEQEYLPEQVVNVSLKLNISNPENESTEDVTNFVKSAQQNPNDVKYAIAAAPKLGYYLTKEVTRVLNAGSKKYKPTIEHVSTVTKTGGNLRPKYFTTKIYLLAADSINGNYNTISSKTKYNVKEFQDVSISATISSTKYWIGRSTVTGHYKGGLSSSKTSNSDKYLLNKKGILYPYYYDKRMGKSMPKPAYTTYKTIPKEDRVTWTTSKRNKYLDWYKDQYGWIFASLYEVHHIRPRSRGGKNDYSNLIPLPTSFHRKQVTPWWSNY